MLHLFWRSLRLLYVARPDKFKLFIDSRCVILMCDPEVTAKIEGKKCG